MTFIQPNKPKSLINGILVLLTVAVLVGTFWLVVAYNQTVNMTHNIAAMKAKLDDIGAENTASSNALIATLSASQAAAIASQDGLVQENNPQYRTVTTQWPIVSR
ncbi:MAG TPA: hypothetical protein VMT99_03485 [Candidatus Paceibacterota bacterium]|nr:hypothetical protein [Candidatus Paceibacterota bacterium]